eukprot:9352261-Lingulodinium_polyedra.AAC.1
MATLPGVAGARGRAAASGVWQRGVAAARQGARSLEGRRRRDSGGRAAAVAGRPQGHAILSHHRGGGPSCQGSLALQWRSTLFSTIGRG